ncbi:pilin glycosylation ligase domain-containing protein [Serratia marcescens]|uniref:pilin glycosylation ligase domain-containing protein n=1 Tax=Serratia marcescens TaxID=615 RepID=UPI001EF7CB08|nr:pilin glycosylation ligase domain-containing protein [Serratia marcescens]
MPPFGGWLAYFPERRSISPVGQVRMTARLRHAVLYLILSATVVQALIVLLQLFTPAIAQSWIPSGNLCAFGIFQQPNVLASFIVTGLAIIVYLLSGSDLRNNVHAI